MQKLFESRRQALKVRLVLWASLVVGMAALYGGWAIFQTYGLSPGDGGVLRPVGERIAFGVFVAGLGLACAIGMMLYATLYVLRLERKEDVVHIETLTPWGIGARRHSFALSELGESTYHHGRFSAARALGRPGRFLHLKVNAPWITLYAAGRRFPFLLDLQADTIKTEQLKQLAAGAITDWHRDRAKPAV